MKILRAFVVILVCFQSYSVAQITQNGEPTKSTEWIGHMGAKGPFVQNTTEAFHEGVRRGYYGLEIDLRVSSDGVFYICHDDVFKPYLFTDRSLHGKRMGGYSWDQLKDLEIKNRWEKRDYSSTLARLEGYLQVIQDNDVWAVIELKWTNGINNHDTANVARLVDLVKSYGVYDRTIFFTSMKPVLTYLYKEYPDANLMFLAGSKTIDQENIDWAIKHNFSIGIPHTIITADIVSQFHRAGLAVNAYTVNSEKDAERLRRLKVDFITTDILGR